MARKEGYAAPFLRIEEPFLKLLHSDLIIKKAWRETVQSLGPNIPNCPTYVTVEKILDVHLHDPLRLLVLRLRRHRYPTTGTVTISSNPWIYMWQINISAHGHFSS